MYRREDDPTVKERLLLILRVEGDDAVPAHAAKDMHRSKPWTSYWLDRFSEEDRRIFQDKKVHARHEELSACGGELERERMYGQ